MASSSIYLNYTSYLPGYPASNIIDGNVNTFYHSYYNSAPVPDNKDPAITLTTSEYFNKIIVYNRVSCCATRITGANIRVYLSTISGVI